MRPMPIQPNLCAFMFAIAIPYLSVIDSATAISEG